MGMKQKEEEYKEENTMSTHPPFPNTHTHSQFYIQSKIEILKHADVM